MVKEEISGCIKLFNLIRVMDFLKLMLENFCTPCEKNVHSQNKP